MWNSTNPDSGGGSSHPGSSYYPGSVPPESHHHQQHNHHHHHQQAYPTAPLPPPGPTALLPPGTPYQPRGGNYAPVPAPGLVAIPQPPLDPAFTAGMPQPPSPAPYWSVHANSYPGYNPRPPVKLPPSCLRCKRSKVRCDREFPCERCRRLNFVCIPQFRPQGRPMKAGFVVAENRSEQLCFPGTQQLLQALHLVMRMNPRVGFVCGPGGSIPGLSVSQPSQASWLLQHLQAWLGAERAIVDKERARRVLRVWRLYSVQRQRDCMSGLEKALTDALGPSTTPEGQQQQKQQQQADEEEMMARFMAAAQFDKDGAAVCAVSRSSLSGGVVGVTCNERFSALFMSKEEMELQLAVMVPELIWERVVQEECRSKYFRLVAEASFLTPGMAGETCHILTVKDRYGVEMLAMVRLGLFVTRDGSGFGSVFSILPLPLSRHLMSLKPRPDDSSSTSLHSAFTSQTQV